jgi:hypothetical protein
LYTFTGLADEFLTLEFLQTVLGAQSSTSEFITIGVGFNSTSSPSGKNGRFIPVSSASGAGGDIIAKFVAPPSLGLNIVSALENATANASFNGTTTYMLLTAAYLA